MYRHLRISLLLFGVSTLCALAIVAYRFFKDPNHTLTVDMMLTADAEAIGELPGSEGRIYGITLEKDQFLHLVAEQHGADVALTLIDPAENELFRVDSPIGPTKAEHLFFVSKVKGTHAVVVQDASQKKYTGRFIIRIRELRPATDRDRKNAKAEAAFYVAKANQGENQLQKAQTGYKEAILLWRELGCSKREADALCKLGEVQLDSGDAQGALEAYKACVDLRKPGHNPDEMSKTFSGMALASEKLGKLGHAEAYFAQAIEVFGKGNRQPGSLTARYNLARVQQLQGKVEEALRHFSQTIEDSRRSRDTELQSKALIGRGGVYSFTGKLDLALDDLEDALLLLDQTESPREAASALTQVALIYAHHGQLTRAIGLVEEALRLRRRAGDSAGEGVTLSTLGSIYFQAGRFDDARDAFQQAAEMFRKERDREKQLRAMANLGQVHAIQGRPEVALRIFNEILPLAREGGNQPAEAALLYGMAYAEDKKGSPLTGLARIEDAINVIEALRSSTDRQDLRESYFAAQEDYYSLKISLLMKLHALRPQAGEDLAAFQTSESARARGLYETLASERANGKAGRNPTLLARHRLLRSEINKLDRQRRLAGLSAKETRRVEARLRKLIGEQEAVEARMYAEARPGWDTDLLPSLSLWEIQNRTLDPDTLLLEYYLGEERSLLWAVGPTSFRGYELQCPDLRELARRVYRTLARSDPPAERRKKDHEDLVRLSECLLGPVADQLGEKRIVVVAHDEIQKIPFSVLPEPSAEATAEGLPLSSRHEVIHLPSVSVLAMLRKQREHRPSPAVFLALVADPVYGAGDDRLSPRGSPGEPEPYDFSRLRFSSEEARQIRALARGRTVEMAEGFDATREWVMKGPVKDARIVHFATHGLLNEEHPGLSGLVLSQLDRQGRRLDGLLQAHEIEHLDLKADLVVLSACQTALGKDVRGEGLVGLTQGFLSGGAAALLVSLWKVDDRATAELMTRFYRALLTDGLPPAAALRRAQMKMQEDPHWQDPYYWSGFILQGEWRLRASFHKLPPRSH